MEQERTTSFRHRIRCCGGPLDGRGFEFESHDRLPWPVVLLDPPGTEPVQYLRLAPQRSMHPGDPWTYVPLMPDSTPGSRTTQSEYLSEESADGAAR